MAPRIRPAPVRSVTRSMRSLSLSARNLAESSQPKPTVSSRSLDPRTPPESKKFIRVPEPLQSSHYQPTRQRGHLPTPRPIFNRLGPDLPAKTSKEYFAKTAPLPAAPVDGTNISARPAWHARMAASRRTALRAGLQGLWQRKEVRDARAAAKRVAAQAKHQQALAQPERTDDVLTRSTIRAAVANPLAATGGVVGPDPERFAKAQASAARTAAHAAARRVARRDALGELYVAARDFIVTEEQLAARVDKVFAEDYWRKRTPGALAMGADGGRSVWAAEGAPLGLSAQYFEQHGGGRAGEHFTSEKQRTVARQKVVAEELTGGKMD